MYPKNVYHCNRHYGVLTAGTTRDISANGWRINSAIQEKFWGQETSGEAVGCETVPRPLTMWILSSTPSVTAVTDNQLSVLEAD
jgi:hypothetical protein